MSMHVASFIKILCYLLKLSSRNEIMGVSWADNSVKIWRNVPISNPKPDIYNNNAHTTEVYSSCHPEMKNRRKDRRMDVRLMDGRTDRHTDIQRETIILRQRETIIPRHYCVAGHKNANKWSFFLYNLHIFVWIQHGYLANTVFALDLSNSVIKRL